MNHILEIDSVQLEYNGKKILSGIYLKSETGKITGLLGKNGSGKSCLMKIAYGVLPCEKSVRFDHMAIAKNFPRPDLITYLPQFHFIPGWLTIGRVFKDFGLVYSQFQQLFPGFTANAKATMRSLSGGNRRLIELYVIVKSASQFSMLDEPFTHLNPIEIERVKKLLQEEKLKKGILITDHLYRHVEAICDNIYVLRNGQTYLTKSIMDIETLGYARL